MNLAHLGVARIEDEKSGGSVLQDLDAHNGAGVALVLEVERGGEATAATSEKIDNRNGKIRTSLQGNLKKKTST